MNDPQDGGVVFKVKTKTSDRQPDWKSSDTGFYVNGEKMELVLWERVDKRGQTYFTGKVSPFRERPTADRRQEQPRRDDPQRDMVDNSEIPF